MSQAFLLTPTRRKIVSRPKRATDAARTRRDESRRFFGRRRGARVVAIAGVVAALCGYLDQVPRSFDYLEQKAYAWRLEMSARHNSALTERAQRRVALVTLSDDSFEWAARRGHPGETFPRASLAALIRELTRDGASAIAFDMLFDQPQPGDADLADALRTSGRVVLACGDKDKEAAQTVLLRPEPALLATGAREGHTRVPVDPERPATDRLEPVVVVGGRRLPALSFEAVRLARGLADRPLRLTPDGWRIGSLTVPMDADGTFKIRFLGPPGETFAPIPVEQIIDGTLEQKKFFRDSHFFQGKIVIVGDRTRIKHDINLTPFGMMPGVEVQAHAVATMLEGKYLREAAPAVNLLLLIVLAAAAALLASVWRLRRAALFLVLLLPAYFAFNFWMFVGRDVFLHLVAPSVTMILTALGVLLERGLTEEQEKTRARGLLQRYVSPQIADHILQHPELLGRAGKRVVGSVLFADIRDFTALSEQLAPEELVSRMNEYFQTMTEVVFRHEGTVSSFVGDAMLALFGVPVPFPDHAQRAVDAAIEMEDALRELQSGWRARGEKVFDIGIGVNSGEMVVGDVGGRRLMQFTVYGVQVNIASRVEGMNRELGTRILITRATYDAVAGTIEVRGPRRATIKGVESEIEVFEVLGKRSETPGAGEAPGV